MKFYYKISAKKIIALTVILMLAGFIRHQLFNREKQEFTDMNSRSLPKGWKADTLKVDKSKRTLMLSKRGKTRRTYSIFLGENPIGDKCCEGDERTPEGIYTLDWRMAKGSCCHKSIHVSYPNKNDITEAKRNKCKPGGSIMIHGMLNGWNAAGIDPGYDWTNGCIGMFNKDIDEVWKYANDGTVIEIKP